MSKRKAQRPRPIGRRTGRRLANGLEVEVFEGPPAGPGVVTADLDSLLAAIERFDPDMPWKKARRDILPMLPRVRPFPGPPLDLVRVMLPPGILVGFGIDIGPAITFVGEPLLRRWKVDVPTVTASALDNLRLLAEIVDPDLVHHDRIGDVPVSVIQTHLGNRRVSGPGRGSAGAADRVRGTAPPCTDARHPHRLAPGRGSQLRGVVGGGVGVARPEPPPPRRIPIRGRTGCSGGPRRGDRPGLTARQRLALNASTRANDSSIRASGMRPLETRPETRRTTRGTRSWS